MLQYNSIGDVMINRNKKWANINFKEETIETCIELTASDDGEIIGFKKKPSKKMSAEPFKSILVSSLSKTATVWDIIEAVTDLQSVEVDKKFEPASKKTLRTSLAKKLQEVEMVKKDELTL